MQRVRVAIIGLGFGAEFIPIYQRHPAAGELSICRRDRKALDAVGDTFGVTKRFTCFADVLADPDIDAVHINTPIPDHGAMTIAALKAGKHVACTVPMATSLAECRKIVALVQHTGLRYMMMETVVYAREFLFMQQLLREGKLGRLQFIQATHQQDMDGWPGYWPGLPPMWYATHCVGPVLGMADLAATAVSCVGSGSIRKELQRVYGSSFAVESAHLLCADSDVSPRILRSLFDTARQYRESLDVYGSKASIEWPLIEGQPLVQHTAKKPEPRIPAPVRCPDFAARLPRAIRPFTRHGVYGSGGKKHLSFTQGAGHGGSHPHLVHEFLSALVEERAPFPDARRSANWTCTGLLAHASALKGGAVLRLPRWTLPERKARS
jgi:predicted dehydrogenase